MRPHPTTEAGPRVATASDASAITDLLVDAFAKDPMWGSSWAFPDPLTRRDQRSAVFRILVEGALRYPWVWLTNGPTSASLWIPPGGSELSAQQETALATVLTELGPESFDRIHAGFELIEAARPREEHYYLTLLGSAPAVSGRGIGLGLLRHALALIDAADAPAYLEAADDLVPVYERFGFRVVGAFVLPDGPTVRTMWRSAINSRT